MKDKQTNGLRFAQLIVGYRWFLFLLVFFVGLGLLLFLRNSQANLFLAVNQYHHPTANEVFKLITHMGDWPFTAFIAFICLFVKYRYAVLLVGSMLYTGMYTQLFKVIVGAPRPSVYFKEIKATINTIDHYVLENSLSFPSGHTTCAFSLAVCLCFIFKGRVAQLWIFFMALIVAFSRVYLAQHFFIDLMGGAIVGTFGALHFIWMLNRSSWFHKPEMAKGLAKRSVGDG